jgi:hypothetical protein
MPPSLSGAVHFPAALSFAPQIKLATDVNPIWVEAVDVNGDKRLDLITNNISSNNFTVHLNLTMAGQPVNFASRVRYPTNMSSAHGLAEVDPVFRTRG